MWQMCYICSVAKIRVESLDIYVNHINNKNNKTNKVTFKKEGGISRTQRNV